VVADESPAVKKAAGIFYTPPDVVDYIVSQTLGRMLARRTVFDIAGQTQPGHAGRPHAPLTVLDPTCGGGFFLIRAYQFLMDWYLDQYVRLGPAEHTQQVHKPPGGRWRLRTKERMRILQEHIFGVDLDPLAVEVTRRSLLLMSTDVETETQGGAAGAVGKNIRCGNMLVGPGFENGGRREGNFASHHRSTGGFDWNAEFPRIAAAGGFDAVIGNPPYVDSESMTIHLKGTRDYCATRYQSAAGNWDIFCVCSERALQLCRADGLVSFIVPNKIGSADYARHIRRLLTSENRLLSLRDYSEVPVFSAGVYPIVFVVAKAKAAWLRTSAQQSGAGFQRARSAKKRPTVRFEKMASRADGKIEVGHNRELDYGLFSSPPGRPWPAFGTPDAAKIVEKLGRLEPLSSVANVVGAATVAEAYDIRPLIRERPGAPGTALRLVNSGTIDRYSCLWGNKRCRYIGNSYLRPVIDAEDEARLPARRRQQARMEKIIVAGMTKRLECIVDPDGTLLAGKSTTIVTSGLDLRLLLGLLNSRLVSFYFSTVFGGNRLQGGYLRVGPPQVRTIPIPIDLPDRHSERGAELSELVGRMLGLQTQQQSAATRQQRTALDHQIQSLDQQIDGLVYHLYDLTDEEIHTIT
jgi:hypothetical protein